MIETLTPLLALLIFGNIENLILASQGVVKGANPKKLLLYSMACVIFWITIGTVGTTIAMDYASQIEIIGAIAIIILGLESMYDALVYKDNDY